MCYRKVVFQTDVHPQWGAQPDSHGSMTDFQEHWQLHSWGPTLWLRYVSVGVIVLMFWAIPSSTGCRIILGHLNSLVEKSMSHAIPIFSRFGGNVSREYPKLQSMLTLKYIEIHWIYGLWMFIYVYGFRLHRVLHQRERKTPHRKFQKISRKLVLIWLFHEIDNPNYGKFSTTLVRHCPWIGDMVKLHKISLFHGNRGFPMDFSFGLPLREVQRHHHDG